MNRLELERAPVEVGEVTTEKRRLVVDIVSASCIALIVVIGASLIKKIAEGPREGFRRNRFQNGG